MGIPNKSNCSQLHTYIHTELVITTLQSRIIDLVFHTTYVACDNFIHKWWDLQFKVDSERQIFWETLHGSFFTLSRVFARNLLRANRRRNTFRILFWCLAWGSNPCFTSNKPTHYLLDYGDRSQLPHSKRCNDPLSALFLLRRSAPAQRLSNIDVYILSKLLIPSSQVLKEITKREIHSRLPHSKRCSDPPSALFWLHCSDPIQRLSNIDVKSSCKLLIPSLQVIKEITNLKTP